MHDAEVAPPVRFDTRTAQAPTLVDPLAADSLVDPLQLQSSTAMPSDHMHALAESGLSGGSEPLPHADRIQESFGDHDVSHVRAHTGSEAQEAMRGMGATGFASGDHVALASTDLHTAAHEAAHVVQQAGGVSLKGGIGATGDVYERHADAVADEVVAGQDASALLDATPSGGGAVQRKAVQHYDREKLAEAKHVARIRGEAAPEEYIAWDDQEWIDAHKTDNDADWQTMHKNWDIPKRTAMLAFRKRYVDAKIEALRKAAGVPLLVKSVGSADLTSDYDLTISAALGGDEDVKAMAAFNAQVKADFGKQPGTVFDTNLYAKDYDKVKEQLNPKKMVGVEDVGVVQPDEDHERTNFVDQDVASLVKVRRYMSQLRYDAYVEEILSGIDSETERKAVRRQYDEADGIYKLGIAELLEAMSDTKVEKSVEPTADEMDVLDLELHDMTRLVLADQLRSEHRMLALRHEHADLVLEHSNRIYAEKMLRVRQVQAKATFLRTIAETAVDPGDKAKLEAEASSLAAEAKKLTADAIFFAAEAYHSEGAIKHIVAGTQGGDKSAVEALDAGQLLQSVNEQFGDYLKDMHHYADAPIGRMFYRTSKYVFRMFDAADLIKQRITMDRFKIEAQLGKSTRALAQGFDSRLVAIRGGKGIYKDAGDAKKEADARTAMGDLLGVDSADGYQTLLTSFAMEINSLVRAKAQSASAHQSAEEVRQYHQDRD